MMGRFNFLRYLPSIVKALIKGQPVIVAWRDGNSNLKHQNHLRFIQAVDNKDSEDFVDGIITQGMYESLHEAIGDEFIKEEIFK